MVIQVERERANNKAEVSHLTVNVVVQIFVLSLWTGTPFTSITQLAMKSLSLPFNGERVAYFFFKRAKRIQILSE